MKAHHRGSSLTLYSAQLKVHWHLHAFVQIQVVILSFLINFIGCVIERASVYWHKVNQLFYNNIAASYDNLTVF